MQDVTTRLPLKLFDESLPNLRPRIPRRTKYRIQKGELQQLFVNDFPLYARLARQHPNDAQETTAQVICFRLCRCNVTPLVSSPLSFAKGVKVGHDHTTATFCLNYTRVDREDAEVWMFFMEHGDIRPI